jgi:hypothetical protein
MLDKFENCPKSAFHKYILKEKEPPSPASEHGNAVHKALEERIKHDKPLPEAYQKYNSMVQSVINAYKPGTKVYAELKMGLTKEFKPCGFFDRDVWGRSAADVVLKVNDSILVFDWKTGKNNEGKKYNIGDAQHKIMAAFLFKHFPTVKRIVGVNLYLESNEVGQPYSFDATDTRAIWTDILVKIQKMERALATMTWQAQPSGLCGWCPVKTCEFNRS